MTARERALMNQEVLLLTDHTLGLGSLISDREAADFLSREKHNFPALSAIGQIRLAAEAVVEYAIAVGNISLDEEFAN